MDQLGLAGPQWFSVIWPWCIPLGKIYLNLCVHVKLVWLTVILENPENWRKTFFWGVVSEKCVDWRSTARTSKYSLWSILYIESEKNQFQVVRFCAFQSTSNYLEFHWKTGIWPFSMIQKSSFYFSKPQNISCTPQVNPRE